MQSRLTTGWQIRTATLPCSRSPGQVAALCRRLQENAATRDIPVLVFSILAISLDLLWGYGGVVSFGHAMFFGESRPYGAILSYWVGPSAGGRAGGGWSGPSSSVT